MQTSTPDKNPLILIVEDHPLTLLAVQNLLLAAFPDCRVQGAGSAEQTLEQCAHEAPHIVVMDISLPGMDGIEATRRVKALAPQTQVVMHSSHDQLIYRDAAASAGAIAFVAKSRTYTDLIPAIRAALPPRP